MGREIRRVPPGWQHPKQKCPHSPWAGGCREALANGGECYRPVYDRDYESAAREWLDGLAAWQKGTHEAQIGGYATSCTYFWEYDAPPDPEYYRPAFMSEPTAFQIYETVSEGTPVSPVFETREAMVDWLVTDGGYDGRLSRAAAERFANDGWVPSMIMTGGQLYVGT